MSNPKELLRAARSRWMESAAALEQAMTEFTQAHQTFMARQRVGIRLVGKDWPERQCWQEPLTSDRRAQLVHQAFGR